MRSIPRLAVLPTDLWIDGHRRAASGGNRLESSMAGPNGELVSNPAAPCGAAKQSGIVREGDYERLIEHLEVYHVLVRR